MQAPNSSTGQTGGKRILTQLFANYFDPGILLIAIGLVSAFILVVLSLMYPADAAARTMESDGAGISPSKVREGSLLFKNQGTGAYSPAPQLKTEVRIEVTGMVAYATVIQEFENPEEEWLEGLYVFPLPEDSAVSQLTMDVGARVIEGVIKERTEAKRTYAAAKDEGRKVSLLEQERPNIFTISVANIGPHETIRVQLAFQQTVLFDNNVFSLRFPTVVGPRYRGSEEPASVSQPDEFNPYGLAAIPGETDNADRIAPPVVEPGQDPSRVYLEVILDPGFNPSRLQSLYHDIDIARISPEKARITLDNDWAVADRDFVLEWAVPEDTGPQAALFSEARNGEHFFYLMVMPPAENTSGGMHIPREVVFVVDVSGSMAGPSLRQAKEALAFGVSRLRADDRFNIISFNDSVDKLFSFPQTGSGQHISRAIHYIEKLEAEGGTQIGPALEQALETGVNRNRMRQLVFLTDGCVGNEQRLFEIVRERLGETRIFSIGIGSAPNSYFMKNIAERGKGDFIHIGKVAEVRERMEQLFRKLENPLLTDIRLAGNPFVEMFPETIPDLYLGEPLTFVAKADEVPDSLKLSGYFAGRLWEREINARNAGESYGISVLWARQKIKNLMDSLDGGADRDLVRQAVIATGLEHHLVSRYTSLVAVDITPARPGFENLSSETVKTNMPRGWQYGKVFGLPRTATVSRLCLFLGGMALFLSGIIWLLLMREKAKKVCRNRKF